MRYPWILWDFDGTLADTLPLALQIFNGLAARHRFLPVDDPQHARTLGTRAFLKRYRIPLWRMPRLVREFQAAQRTLIAGVRLFDGIPELLRELRAGGRKLGILSSNSQENIATCLRNNGADGLFEFVVGYPRLFGKARMLRRLLKTNRIAPDDALYVGDEERDVHAAGRARIDVAAVTWGFHTPELLGKLDPTYLVHEPAGLAALLTTATLEETA